MLLLLPLLLSLLIPAAPLLLYCLVAELLHLMQH